MLANYLCGILEKVYKTRKKTKTENVYFSITVAQCSLCECRFKQTCILEHGVCTVGKEVLVLDINLSAATTPLALLNNQTIPTLPMFHPVLERKFKKTQKNNLSIYITNI
jgi:hypothetical protein